MRRFIVFTLCLTAPSLFVAKCPALLGTQPQVQKFAMKMQEVERGFKVGYAVRIVDVDGDGKKDIVAVDTTRVVWYQNPSWKRHPIIEGQTKPDNVCIAPYDIDGDGKVDFALGAGWGGLNTKSGGTIQWLKRGKKLSDRWSVHPISEEPTVHRIRFADVDGDSNAELIVVPLMGRNSSGKMNWMNGQPVRTNAFHIPQNPESDRWISGILDESLHVVHNFWPIPAMGRKGKDILMASYEGVSIIERNDGKWRTRRIGKGNQENLKSRRGASEIKQGTLKGGMKFIATVEPWHGNQVVVYTPPGDKKQMWQRHVIDEQLRWGHAVWCADLDGDGGDELIIGVRDNPAGKDKFNEKRGVRIYKASDGKGQKWTRQIIDNGGMACEDLAADDLNGDGRIDIVAVGRQTHNMRIYWNQARK